MNDIEAWRKEVDRFKQIREEKKQTQREAAEELGISEQYLNMIELGEIMPTEKEQAAVQNYIMDNLA